MTLLSFVGCFRVKAVSDRTIESFISPGLTALPDSHLLIYTLPFKVALSAADGSEAVKGCCLSLKPFDQRDEDDSRENLTSDYTGSNV